MFGRVWVEALVVNQSLAQDLILPLGVPLSIGTLWCLYLFFTERPTEPGQVNFSNPFQLEPAIRFGLFFAGVLLLAEWTQDVMGSGGVYLSSVASGLTDVDAKAIAGFEQENCEPIAGDSIHHRVRWKGNPATATAAPEASSRQGGRRLCAHG